MNNFKFWVKKNSPTILMVSAIVNETAAIVLACLATKRLPNTLKPVSKQVVKLHEKMEKKPEQEKEIKKDLTKLYIKTGGKIALMYAPAVLSFSFSVASMVGSHNILQGRNAALAAAFTTLKGGYDAYRQRVKDKLGDEAEKEIFDGSTKVQVKEKDENGKIVTKTVTSINPEAHESDFCVLFGPDCVTMYDRTHPQLNITMLEEAERIFNRRLVAKGYVFLHEIYEYLGFPESYLGPRRLQASRVLGWRYSKENQSGDNFIDFGIHNSDGTLTDAAKQVLLGFEDSVWLILNPDGDILTGDNGPSFVDEAIKKGL